MWISIVPIVIIMQNYLRNSKYDFLIVLITEIQHNFYQFNYLNIEQMK